MKIGIITHYYKSTNYGGNLQAYALCKVLRNLGYDAEQICYQRTTQNITGGLYRTMFVLKKAIRNIFNFFYKISHIATYKNISNRTSKINKFNLEITHSDSVYTDATLVKLGQDYDVLIAGSDQVWHPSAVCDAYLLNIPTQKKIVKIAYAASCAVDFLPKEIVNKYKNALSDFMAISVREENAVNLIAPISPVDVKWVIDPVFLLSANEWNLITSEKKEKDPYVFCYFLGDSDLQRSAVCQFARKKGMKIVTMPYLTCNYRKCDKDFGDKQLFDIAPGDFISLIKNANYIFTDSFHATAFSLIYKKQFFVFERKYSSSIASRINSVCEIFNTKNRFCNEDKMTRCEYLIDTPDVDYSVISKKYQKMQEESLIFLRDNLEKAEQCIYEKKQ